MTPPSSSSPEYDDPASVAAAIMIQRLWRGTHNVTKDRLINAEQRWDDAANQARLAVNRNAALDEHTTPRQRWKRAAAFVGQLKFKNEMLSSNGVQVDAEEKFLETQHWLEMIDGKHRYGSNRTQPSTILWSCLVLIEKKNAHKVKWYHRRWQQEDTKENFFKWLDQGGGKDVNLDECSRERLEKERIIYLSAEQRLNYLVKIGEDGHLYWEKNNQPVDTTAGDWKDAGDGLGIVPQSMPVENLEHSDLDNGIAFSSAHILRDDSKNQISAATHYLGVPKGKYWWSKYVRRHFTTRGVMERLLRKTVKRNTWIYVSDKNFNIFIGIKETGAFQHSSFVAGGIVTSAGLISVKEGVIHTLSPLSGHYRTSVNHFHRFIEVLTERGVDMRKVKISKAEAALWGIEHLGKFKKAQSYAVSSGKKKLRELPEEAKVFLAEKSFGTHKWKKEVLEGRAPEKSAVKSNTDEDVKR